MKPGATEKVFSECSPSDRREGGGKVRPEEEVSRLVVYRQPCLHPKMQLQETKLSLPPPEILVVGLSTAVQWQQGHRLQSYSTDTAGSLSNTGITTLLASQG